MIEGNKRKMRKKLCLTFYVCLMLSNIFNFSSAYMPTLNYIYENKGWSLKYSFSEWRAEPGDTITIDIEIVSNSKNYDFRLWLEVGEPLEIIGSNAKKSHLYYSELNEGDIRFESLGIKFPQNVEYGEKYSIGVKVESHNNPSGWWGKRIVDNPEYKFNSKTMSGYNFDVNITNYPELKLNSVFKSYSINSIENFEVTLKNIGNADAEEVQVVILPQEGLIIHEGENLIEIDKIVSKSSQTLTWKIQTSESGTYVINFKISSSNHKTIDEEISIKVESGIPGFYIETIIMGILLALFILYIMRK